MIRPQKYQATIVKKDQLNKNVFFLSFALILPKEIIFSSGQRGLFNIGTKFNNYSFCSFSENKDLVSICVDTTPDGPGSKWIKQRIVGDKIEFIGPLGNFIVSNSAKAKIFLATGTGISPFRSMIHHLLNTGFNKDIYLYFGERYQEDIFWQQEFKSFQDTFKNFHYQIVLSRPDVNWVGEKGYVQMAMEADLFVKLKNNPLDFEYYICGNSRMIADACMVLEKENVNKTDINIEKFYDLK